MELREKIRKAVLYTYILSIFYIIILSCKEKGFPFEEIRLSI